MSNFYTKTKNPIARAGIIRKLMKMGYVLAGQYTVSDYFIKWPAAKFPYVVVINNSCLVRKPTIDLASDMEYVADHDKYQYVSPVTLAGVPDLTKKSSDINTLFDSLFNPKKAVVFPPAAKYNIRYQKQDGTEGDYVISNPIEETNASITAYAFGRGIRTFVKHRVLSFSKAS